MEYKDYYKTLGVARDAPQADIKRAFRKLARKYHPDVSKESNAEARFKEVNEANEVLQDPEKRAAYDALGSSWQPGQDFRPPPGGGRSQREYRFSTDETADFSDFFSSIFGSGGGFRAQGGKPRPRRGQDQTARLHITLEDAYRGVTRQLHLDVPEVDPDGRLVTRSRTLNVRIPAGVTQGQQIRLAGQGAPGTQGATAGDLFLEIDFEPHAFLRPEGRNIHLNLPVAPWEAALGATVPVPTLAGAVNLKIPAGTQTGKRMRLKGRGLPGDPPGDAYIVIEVTAPPADTEVARDAYRRLAEACPSNPRAALGV
jgi:curved DNA-binding protein